MNNFQKQIQLKDKSYKNILKIVHPIKKDFEKIYDNLTDEQIESMRNYKGFGYLELNRLLYNNTLKLNFNKLSNLSDIIDSSLDFYVKQIQTLDSIFSYKSKTKMNTFRGISSKEAEMFNQLNKKDTYLFKNFLSTSLNPAVAFQFTDSIWDETKNYDKNRILLDIELPKNFNFFYLTWLSKYFSENNNKNNFQNNKSKKKLNSKKYNSKKKLINQEKLNSSEFELLLPRNCVFKIKNISTIEERYFTSDREYRWDNYEKFMNTNNNLKKIKVYHLKFIKIEDIAIPNAKNIKIDDRNVPTKNLYYIPPSPSKYNNNNY